MSQNTPVSSKIIKLSINIYLIYIFSNFQYFWTKTFWDSYTSIQQIFSTWQWLPSIWCDYIWICKNVQYLNEKPVKVEERSKFTIVNMFSMHINNFFFLFYLFFLLLKDCVFSGLFVFRTTWCRDFFISTAYCTAVKSTLRLKTASVSVTIFQI